MLETVHIRLCTSPNELEITLRRGPISETLGAISIILPLYYSIKHGTVLINQLHTEASQPSKVQRINNPRGLGREPTNFFKNLKFRFLHVPFRWSHMSVPFSIVGHGSNVRVSLEYSNPEPSEPIVQSYRQPGNGVTLSNSGCIAHDIATLDEITLSQHLVNAVSNSSFHNVVSMPQPHISADPTDGFDPGNYFSDPITYSYQEGSINAQTIPQASYLDTFENSLTGSPARYMQAIAGGPKTGFQLSVEAPFQTPVQNNLASAGDESSVPPLVIEYQRFSPLGNNLHGINIQHVLDSEEIEQIHAPIKTKHVFSVPSHFLPRYKWCYASGESRATSTQSSPPFPLRIWWNLAFPHLQEKELLVRCRSSARICYMKG